MTECNALDKTLYLAIVAAKDDPELLGDIIASFGTALSQAVVLHPDTRLRGKIGAIVDELTNSLEQGKLLEYPDLMD